MLVRQRIIAGLVSLSAASLIHCIAAPELPSPGTEEVAGDWTCVGSLSWPHARPTMATLAFRAARPLRYAESTLRACARGDLYCSRPVDSATLAAADGWEEEPFALLHVPTGTRGWDGYVELTVPGHDQILAFEAPPITGDRAVREVPQEELFAFSDWLLATVRAEVDPTRGQVGFEVVDCAGQPAEGATVVVDVADGATAPIYFVAGVPVLGEGTTDAGSGAMGMLVNVPAGRATLTVSVGDARAPVSEVTVLTRAGALTTVSLQPTPDLDPVDIGAVGASVP